MDSDQDSVDDWVVLASSSSSSDDERVIALSSGCDTPNSCSSRAGSGTDSEPDHAAGSTKFLLAYAAADPDDPEGVYGLSDAEDTDATLPPSPPLPKPLSGLFHHTLAGDVAYAAFDPVPPAAAHLRGGGGHHGAKQLVPDPTFAAFFHEPVAALASTRGLVCLRGTISAAYYVANPATFARERLPSPSRDHRAHGDPAVVIAFDLEPRDADPERADALEYKPFYRHYHVVVAFPIGDGIYAFESFSSRAWKWTMGADVADADTVDPGSGVGVLGCAFWRTTMGPFLCYEPVSRCSDLVPTPPEVMQWPYWELGEMEGTLCVTCMDARVDAVVVIRLDFARRTTFGAISWTLAGHFEGGCLRGRQDVKLLRSQGKAEVVMWDPSSETVVAMNIEGRTTRTIRFIPGSAYYADFIPYVRSLAAFSASGSSEQPDRPLLCPICGKVGHVANACPSPVMCSRCHKEGHVARVCSIKMPWEFISPFCGLSAYGQGFHVTESVSNEEGIKDMSTTALVTVTVGQASARQIENEFKLKAGPNSSWRWYAKRIGEGKYQMRFPNSQNIDDLAHFTEMRMRSAPEVVIKVEKWNPISVSKGPLDVAWFRITNIPFEKRSYSNVCMVASKVGLPLEVDRDSLHKNDYVRVKIGCRDVTKVPASVDGVLDFHFYDYFFQREVPQDGYTDPTGTKWIRNERDQQKEDFPSPKKQKMEQTKQPGQPSEAGPSKTYSTSKGKQVVGDGSGTASQQQASSEDSEDESLLMGDLVVPGYEQLRFGNFDNMELRKVVFNEYGSNFMKFKLDSLMTIEVKNAIFDSKREDIFQFDDIIGKSGSTKKLPTIMEDKGGKSEEKK